MIVEKEDAGLRLDLYLSENIEISRSRIQKAIEEQAIKVNGEAQKSKYKVKDGDSIYIDYDFFELEEIKPEKIEIEVVYEDDDIAVINKPYDMITHPTETIRTKTLVNALMYRFDNLSDINGPERRGIVHRLDKDTTGLMLVAKNNKSHENLALQFKNHQVEKHYLALACGNFKEDKELIETYIDRDKNKRKLMKVSDSGKYAKTGIEVLSQVEGYSLLDLRLYTGRTHQIRVHLKYLGRPILGDADYNNKKSKYKPDHQLLHSYKLRLKHPITGENLEFERKPGGEFEKYLEILGLHY